jgi:hypothetical protein
MSEKDNTKLKPAEENPWYVLATLYGENPDKNTLALNKGLWNKFFKHKLEGQPLAKEISERFNSRLPGQFLPNPQEGIDFSNTDFKKPLNLKTFEFPKFAKFANSRFNRGLILQAAKFDSDANFSNAKFFVVADFGMVEFTEQVIFYQSDFYTDGLLSDDGDVVCVRFDKAIFKGLCTFMDASFHRSSSFNNCQFVGPCDLSKAKFEKNYPVIESSVFHQKTTLSAKKEYWPSPQNCEQNPEEAKATCEILREQMETQGLHDEAHFFFRREMHFAGKMLSPWQRLPNNLFACLSAYGFSLKRPLSALAFLWALPMAIFWVNICTGKCANTIGAELWVSLIKMAGLSIANIFQITGLQRVYWSEFIQCLPSWMKFLGGAQTLLAIPLLFLLLLGLRNRFRLK